MRFLLEPGDAALSRPCPAEELRPGEVALLVKWCGGLPAGYVIHRVLLNLRLPGVRIFLTKGDANFLPDWPPADFQPAARIWAFERAGRRYLLRGGVFASFLVPVYSLSLGKLLYLCAALASSLFSLSRRLLPSPAGELLNRAYFNWEACWYPALLAALAAPASPGPGEAGAAACAVRSGRIRRDETWSGRVIVADYLTVERGATLTLQPGTEVLFERREPWFFPVERAGVSGEDRALESAGAKVLVYGELRAAGTELAPVRLGGVAFAGLYALGAGRIRLEHTDLGGSSACAFSARDSATLSAVACSVSACARGAEAFGDASLTLEDCVFCDCAGPALLAGDHATALVYGGSCALPLGRAAELSGSAAAAFSGFTAAGCASGFWLCANASLRLEDCSVSAASGSGADCCGKSVLRVSRSAFSGNSAGLRLSGDASAECEALAFSGNTGPAVQARAAASARLRGCSFYGHAGPALELSTCGRTELRGCTFHGGESAADAMGRGGLLAEDCSFERAAGAALRVRALAFLEVKRCRFLNCRAGVSAKDCASAQFDSAVFLAGGPALCFSGPGRLRAAGCVFDGNSVGADISGEASAVFFACRFEHQTGAPLLLSGRASAELGGCGFTANRSGAALSGRARAAAQDCTFDASRGPAFELSGAAQLAAAACRISGPAPALLADGFSSAVLSRVSAESSGAPAVSLGGRASLYARGCSFASGTDAVYARGDSSLFLHGCRLSAGTGAALDLDLLKAELRSVAACGAGGLAARGRSEVEAAGLQLRVSDYGVDFSGAELRLTSFSCAGGVKGGVRVNSGLARLRGAVLTAAPYPGLEAAAGARLYARGVTMEGQQWRPPVRPRCGSASRAVLFRFVSATARLPVFSALYRLYYLAAARAAALALQPGKGGSLYLYRGMAAGGWVPGLSDMDLAALSGPAAVREDWLAHRRLAGRLSLFRAVFPFTGEVLSAPAEQFPEFMQAWGVKGAEFSAASRLLSGPGIALGARAGGSRADLTEAFYAYTLLLGHFLSDGLPPAFRARNCQKGLLDVKRYLDAAAPARYSRIAYAAAVGADLNAPPDPAKAAFESFRALHAACPSAEPSASAAPAANPPWFNTHAFEAACAGLETAAGCRTGVALDALYRVYVVLPDALAADEAGFLKAAAALKAARASGSYFSASPLLLTEASFRTLAGLPYLNNPLFWLDLAAPAAGGASPADGGVFLCKAPRPAGPGPEATRASAALAAAHFAVSWRSLWENMPPHYFFTRAAGLRLLLEKGAAPAFSRPAAVGESFRAAFGAGPDWSAYRASGASRENYEFVAEQAAACLEAVRGR